MITNIAETATDQSRKLPFLLRFGALGSVREWEQLCELIPRTYNYITKVTILVREEMRSPVIYSDNSMNPDYITDQNCHRPWSIQK